MCADGSPPAAKCIAAQSKAGRVCEARRHGGGVEKEKRRKERKKKKKNFKKNVLPELERRARGDLRRQAFRSGAVL